MIEFFFFFFSFFLGGVWGMMWADMIEDHGHKYRLHGDNWQLQKIIMVIEKANNKVVTINNNNKKLLFKLVFPS